MTPDKHSFEAALKRVGVGYSLEAVLRHPLGRKSRVRLAGYMEPDPDTGFESIMFWVGSCEVALARLAVMPDDAGWEVFSKRFPPWEWVAVSYEIAPSLYAAPPPPPFRRWLVKRRSRRERALERRTAAETEAADAPKGG